jgi:serine phosphatase RsbU (regulator of sigma subunit)
MALARLPSRVMARGGGTATWNTPVQIVVVALAYYLSAKLGLQLALVGDIVTPLWPPTGVAIVALAAFGLRVAPAIALAALAVNLPIASSAGVAAVIAVGNTLAPVAGATLLRRLRFDAGIQRLRDAIVLVGVALVSMTISASVGTAAVNWGEDASTVWDTWWVWWAGDAMGVLIVAPFLWSLWRARLGPVDWSRVAEAAALYGVLFVAAVVTAPTEDALFFVVLPLIAWIGWRFQQLGAAPAGLIVSTVVILAAVDDRGVFADDALLDQMLVLQIFNASVALASFVFAAAFIERRQFLESLYERERRVAEMLQRSMLPEHLPDIAGITVAARYIPASDDAVVGGDWYDIMRFSDGTLGLVIGDVVGHGVDAAAAMAQLRAGVRAYSLARTDPARTLAAVNRMSADLHPGMVATLLYAELDPRSGRLQFASAGHLPPLLADRTGRAEYLEGGLGVPIGVADDFETDVVTHCVEPGSTLVLFTDGICERRGEAMDDSLDRFRQLVTRVAAPPAQRVDADAICAGIVAGADVGQAVDDVALLVLRVDGIDGIDGAER